MNNFKSIKRGLLLMLTSLMFLSCVDDDDYDVPPIETILPCTTDWQPNITIGELVNKNVDGAPLLIEEDLILEGYVVSTDRNGNFFKSLVIQDSPTNPTYGMSVELDIQDTYRKFPVGGKVLVNARGLYFGKDRATYKIGSTYVADNGEVRLGRMSEVVAMDKVRLLCDSQTEVIPQTFSTIADFKANAVVNTLIKLENVQFDDITDGDTYYDEEGNTFGGATNRELIDRNGDKIVLRTSQYTDFAGEVMPMGSGTIIAVLSAYSNNNNPTPSTYQLFLRDIVDVQMDNPRFGETPPDECEEPWEVNATLAEIKALNDTAVPMEITEDLVFAGYVISNDEEGNFFKTLSIQDSPVNPTAGMSIEMNVNDIYKAYPIGSKVLVNAKGMFVAKDRGTYKIGSTFDDNGTLRVGRLSESEANAKLAKSCMDPVEIIPTSFTSIEEALEEGLINTLVTFEDVTFSDAGNGATYYMGDNSGYNHKLEDSQGFSTIVRTSKYADFNDEVVPTGRGNVTAVLSAYAPNNMVTDASYQLYLRDTEDVDIN
ncbi:hypothetical protein GO491_07920 [Flavobacteriaceae bacterium Ap0902]|nr:hypothetical protein [Flavobacteriaceae bacterium Ap0902]